MKLLGLNVYVHLAFGSILSARKLDCFACTEQKLNKGNSYHGYGEVYGSTKSNWGAVTSTQARNFESLN